ncbi:MAG: PilN domain-containing protein [Candidatus Omnitrophica bacterium]|nr:PilN domain-containing protein [Candidatus Omnitrophota bacterium]
MKFCIGMKNNKKNNSIFNDRVITPKKGGKNTLILELGKFKVKTCNLIQFKRNTMISDMNVFEFAHQVSIKDLEDIYAKLIEIKPDNLFVSIHRSFFLRRLLKIPSRDKVEIKKMLPFQLSKVVPHFLDEVIYDFSLVSTNEKFSNVEIFFIKHKKIVDLIKLFKKYKTIPDYITMSSCGLNNWLNFQYKILKENISYPIALIDIDCSVGEFLVINEKGIIFTRAFNFLDDKQLLEEVDHTKKIFEKEWGDTKFDKTIFTGIKNKYLLEKINKGEILYIKCSDNFSITEKCKEIVSYKASLASILGLSVQNILPLLEFSPQSVCIKRKKIENRKKNLQIGVIFIEILLIIATFFGRYLYDKINYLNLLNTKLEGIQVEADLLDEVSDKFKVVGKKFIGTVSYSEILHSIISTIPKESKLTVLEFNDDGKFFIKGYSSNISNIFDMVTVLNYSKIFKNVKVKYASKIKSNNLGAVEFYINGDCD